MEKWSKNQPVVISTTAGILENSRKIKEIKLKEIQRFAGQLKGRIFSVFEHILNGQKLVRFNGKF